MIKKTRINGVGRKIRYTSLENNLSEKSIVLMIFLLGFNYLLYNFFSYDTLKNVVRIVVAVLILFNVCTSKRRFSIGEISAILISMYLIMLNGNTTLNISFIILTVICIQDTQNMEKIYLRVSIVLVLIVVISLLTHFVQTTTYTVGGRTRNSLGFYNPNASGLFFFSALILFLYSKNEIKMFHIIISLLISYMVFRITDSRTSFIGIILFIAIYILLSKYNFVGNVINLLAIVCFISPFLWSALLADNADLDFLLSGRIHIFNNYIAQSTTLTFIFGGNTHGEIDNFYLVFLYNVGIILYILFAVITFKALKYYRKNKDYKCVSYIISVLCVGLMESGPLRCEIVCMILFWTFILKPTLRPQKVNSFTVIEQ